jgi:hypothetical protein
MAHRPVHRLNDSRDCGAGTKTQCSDVRVNSRFISIQDDNNSHGGGALVATLTKGRVQANNKPVILVRDPARADNLCPTSGGSHCNPRARTASPNVRAGNGS